MQIVESKRLSAVGMVKPSFVDIATGKKMSFDERHNTLSYMASKAVAAAMGGDPSYIPCRMGFIYGNSASLPISDVITRDQTWNALLESLADSGDKVMDIQVVNFSYPPTLGHDADDSSNSSSVTFHAISNSPGVGELEKLEFIKDKYIYQCLLLGYYQGEYYIIARASLKQGDVYLAKPDKFEIALDWTITFS